VGLAAGGAADHAALRCRRRIGQVKAPVLVVHGSEDRLIPPDLGRTLYERGPEPKRWVLVEGGSHHNTNSLAQDQYRAAVRDLFGVPAQLTTQGPHGAASPG
jgi:pimeloyl-ACP methyl ester carboxylesterase